MTVHFTDTVRSEFSTDIRDYDTPADPVISINARLDLDIEGARAFALDLLKQANNAELHFRRSGQYQDGKGVVPENWATLPDICKAEPSEGYFVQRRIVAAANRFGQVPVHKVLRERLGTEGDTTDLVIVASRHYSTAMHVVLGEINRLRKIAVEEDLPIAHNDDQGFIDQFDRYWTREEAFIIAKHAGQINATRPEATLLEGDLYSENLY